MNSFLSPETQSYLDIEKQVCQDDGTFQGWNRKFTHEFLAHLQTDLVQNGRARFSHFRILSEKDQILD